MRTRTSIKSLARGLAILAVFLSVSAVLGRGALADTAPIPANVGLPWSDPGHQSPLELLASTIASHIDGRTTAVHCDGDYDWNVLTQQRSFDPNVELGYVEVPQYERTTRRFLTSASAIELSPAICMGLQQYAIATTKPTKCQPVVTTTTTEYVTQRVRVTVRVRVHGKLVKKKVWTTKQVPTTVTHDEPGPPTPCYLGNKQTAASEPTSYWHDYGNYALSMLVLAHTSIHVSELREELPVDSFYPTSETHANCYGLQWVSYVAAQLGATPDDARAVSMYVYDDIYPGYQGVTANGSPYWSADCRQDGPLDLTPGDGVWP